MSDMHSLETLWNNDKGFYPTVYNFKELLSNLLSSVRYNFDVKYVIFKMRNHIFKYKDMSISHITMEKINILIYIFLSYIFVSQGRLF